MQTFKRTIFIFIIFLLNVQLLAGNSLSDSLQSVLQRTMNDTTKFRIYLSLIKLYSKHNVDSSFQFANKAILLAKDFDDDRFEAQAENEMGHLFLQLGNYGRSIEYYFAVLKIYEERKDSLLLIASYFNIALVYDKLNENQKAQDYYLKALNIVQSMMAEKNKRVLTYPIGRIYNNIGITYHNFKQYDKALEYYHKAIQISEETNNTEALSYVYNNIGLVYKELGDYDIALTFFEKALSIKIEQHEEEGTALTYSYFGDCYSLKKNTEKAIEYYQKGLQLAEKIHATNLQMNIAGTLINEYAKIKQYDKSYQMHLIYKTLSDSLDLQESTRTANMLDMQYKFDKEQKEMELEQQKRFYWNLTISGILFTLLVVTTLLFFLAQSKVRRTRLQRENLKLERDKLEDELNYKNKELTTNVMYLLRKNELINSISVKLLNLKDSLVKANQKPVQDIINEMQRSVDDDVWKEFEFRFKDVHESFYKRLNELFPDLTQNEKKLCAFLRLNMSTKEISAITFQSPHSITIARARLRKKLNLTNQDVNLVEFLSKIE